MHSDQASCFPWDCTSASHQKFAFHESPVVQTKETLFCISSQPCQRGAVLVSDLCRPSRVVLGGQKKKGNNLTCPPLPFPGLEYILSPLKSCNEL